MYCVQSSAGDRVKCRWKKQSRATTNRRRRSLSRNHGYISRTSSFNRHVRPTLDPKGLTEFSQLQPSTRSSQRKSPNESHMFDLGTNEYSKWCLQFFQRQRHSDTNRLVLLAGRDLLASRCLEDETSLRRVVDTERYELTISNTTRSIMRS